ncbi:MAG: transporter [Alphaproteobacteria bacterium]
MIRTPLRAAAGLLASALFSAAAPAQAQQAMPDKSQYNLFNPTPDDALRPFNTDRPAKATGPYTVDAGRLQVETDFAFYSYDQANAANVTQRSWTVADPTFRVGLTSDVELDVISSGFYNNVKSTDRAAGTSQTDQGFGDVTLSGKINLLGNDDGDIAFAVIPQIKFPAATGGVGNGAYEGGVLFPVSFALPLDVTMTLVPEFGALKNTANNGHSAAFSQIINFSRAIVENLTGYVEFFAGESAEAGAKNAYTFDVAAAYVIAPNLQLDAGTNIGLNRAVSDIQAYFGISKRF